jgi:acyl carrier protein
MTETEFVAAVAEILGLEPTKLAADTPLESIESYDSLGKISLIALVDEQFDHTLSPTKLRQLKTCSEIYSLAKNKTG